MKFILVFFSFMLSMAGSVLAQPIKSVEVTVTISNDLKKDFIAGGRLLLRISKQYEKVQGNRSEMNVGVTAKNWDATNAFVLDANGSGVLSIGLEKIGMPATEKYYYQVLYRQNVDGNDSVATYLYSNVDSFQFAKKVRLKATLHNVSREQAIINHPFVKAVTIKSKYLSDFFGKPKYLKASILLPSGYFDHPGKVYPICYRASGLNGRYTAVNSLMNEGKFADWWFAKNAPQVIYVFLDSQGPYGDTYQVDSENNGPCSKALTEELIPAIEKEVKYQPETGMRYLAGRSTGGWIALGLQVFYPDFFDGAFSYSPDPVDFEHFGLIDIYHDSTIFYNQWGYLQPGRRTIYGQPTFSMQDWIAGENVFSHTNDYRVSGRQFGAFNAVFGPKGKDGLPSFMFDP